MYMYKKFLGVFSISFLFFLTFIPAAVSAQTFINEDGQTEAPQLSIIEVLTNQPNYALGDTIRGSFELFNNGLSAANEVYYTVGIVELIESEGFYYPVNEISVGDKSESFTVMGGGKDIEYSFEIPESIPAVEQYGVMVNVYENGSLSALELTPVVITGEKQEFVTYGAQLSLGNGLYDKFGLLEGPEVYEDETLVVSVDFSSSAYKPDLVIPIVEVRDGINKQGDVVVSAEGSVFSLDSERGYEQGYVVPTNIEPGVYTVVIHFVDENKKPIAVPLEARYIISGIKPKIDTIYFGETDQSKIYAFDVSVVYQDTPVSSRRDDDGNFIDPRAATYFNDLDEVDPGYVPSLEMNAKISLFSEETGELIQEKTGVFGPNFQTTVSFDPIVNHSLIRTDVTLFNQDESVDTDSVIVEVIPATDRSTVGIFKQLFSDKGFLISVSVIVIIVFLLLLLVIIKLKKKPVSEVKTDKNVDGLTRVITTKK